MKPLQIALMSAALILTAIATDRSASGSLAAPAPQAPTPQPPTLASALDREITTVEKQIIDIAEAMPEDKFNFSPESLNIPGGDYKGARLPCRRNTSLLRTASSGRRSPAKSCPKA